MRALLFSLLALLVTLSSAFYVPRDDLFYASSFEKRAKFYEYPRSDINTNKFVELLSILSLLSYS